MEGGLGSASKERLQDQHPGRVGAQRPELPCLPPVRILTRCKGGSSSLLAGQLAGLSGLTQRFPAPSLDGVRGRASRPWNSLPGDRPLS